MIEKLEPIFVANEKFIIKPSYKISSYVRENKSKIAAVAVIASVTAGAAYLGAYVSIKNVKMNINLLPKDGTAIPIVKDF